MKKYILMGLVGATLVSCKLDDNISPNNPQSEDVSPALRLNAAETSSYAVQAGTMNGLGNAWMNSWSGNFATFGNPFSIETGLQISTTYRQAIWINMYRALARYQAIIDNKAAAENPNYVAIAKIMKAYYMMYLVDIYGDLPYSEAFKGVDGLTPKYDKGADVYAGLANEVVEALGLINESDPKFAVTDYTDPTFAGDMSQWKKFANTVLLKFVVRLSKTTDPEGISLKNNLSALVAGQQFISGDVTINPGYNNDSAAGQNPLYNNFGRGTFDGQINTQGWRLMTASDHLINTLQGEASTVSAGVNDVRIGRLFTKGKKYNNTPSGGASGYYGYKQGETNDMYKIRMGYTIDDLKPVVANFSFLGGTFYAFPGGASEPGYIMLASEVEFLKSEAALLGLAGFNPGQAQGFFDAGVTASFVFDGFAASDASAYLTAISSNPKAGWTNNATDDLAAIQFQRWIALVNYNGFESYVNFLRTGYPVSPLGLDATQPNRPYRLMYPANEYSTNPTNVPNVSRDECFSVNQFTPFTYK